MDLVQAQLSKERAFEIPKAPKSAQHADSTKVVPLASTVDTMSMGFGNLTAVPEAVVEASMSRSENLSTMNISGDLKSNPGGKDVEVQFNSSIDVEREFQDWLHRFNKSDKLLKKNMMDTNLDFSKVHRLHPSERKFFMKQITKAIHDKEDAKAIAVRHSNTEKKAEGQVAALYQLIDDIKQKKEHALMVVVNGAKTEKRKFDEAVAEALARSESYDRVVEKGEQAYEAILHAKEKEQQAKTELDKMKNKDERLKQQLVKQIEIATSAAAEAIEHRKLADNVNSVLGETMHINELKDAARTTRANKKKLEKVLREKTSGNIRHLGHMPPHHFDHYIDNNPRLLDVQAGKADTANDGKMEFGIQSVGQHMRPHRSLRPSHYLRRAI